MRKSRDYLTVNSLLEGMDQGKGTFGKLVIT
jgi:hypothetical protein